MTESTTETTFDLRKLATQIEEFYRLLNDQRWIECFELVDPKLREAGKVEVGSYSSSLASFFSKHGPLVLQSLDRLRIYADAANKHDDRDFAYAMVKLEDRDHLPLKIRERGIKASDGRWYTRMAGMV